MNNFEFHKDLTSKIGLKIILKKIGLVKSLLRHYNQSISIPFNILPMAFIINFEDCNWENDIQTFVEFYNNSMPEKFKNGDQKKSLNLQFYR